MRFCPTRKRTPTISPGCGGKVIGSIHISWAKSGVKPSAMAHRTAPDSGDRSSLIMGMLRNRDGRHGRNVNSPVPLKQTLVGRRQEREPVQIVLVVDLHTFCQ